MDENTFLALAQFSAGMGGQNAADGALVIGFFEELFCRGILFKG